MKRFYCTECKKIKRVRVIPLSVKQPEAEDVMERTGKCKWHSRNQTNQSMNRQYSKVG